MLTQALTERMGVNPANQRVRLAVTMWSAIAAGAYPAAGHADQLRPRHDDRLPERMIARPADTFTEVTCEALSSQLALPNTNVFETTRGGGIADRVVRVCSETSLFDPASWRV